MRATARVALRRHAVRADRPFLVLTGKGGKERLVPLSERALKAVARHAANVPAEARYLFPSGKKHLSRVRLFQLVRTLGADAGIPPDRIRSEEHTSELQSLMRSSYAVFCLTKTITSVHYQH